MFAAVNIWTILLATVAAMIIGSVWYSPKVLGTKWAKLSGATLPTGRPPVEPLVTTVVVCLITAWVLANFASVSYIACGSGGGWGRYFGAALLTGLLLWLGLTATRFITHDRFEGRPLSLTVINLGLELVTIMVMAIIIGVWPPAGLPF